MSIPEWLDDPERPLWYVLSLEGLEEMLKEKEREHKAEGVIGAGIGIFVGMAGIGAWAIAGWDGVVGIGVMAGMGGVGWTTTWWLRRRNIKRLKEIVAVREVMEG